jgi:hypothetical protein
MAINPRLIKAIIEMNNDKENVAYIGHCII